MLKRSITYKNFDGEEETEIFYFNLSKTEIVDLEVEEKEGFEVYIKRIINANDSRTLVKEFKRIILMSYGEKTPDGRRFVKSEELANAFSQTAAFDTLFMELATNDKKAAEFIEGILPNDLGDQDKPRIPPPPPVLKPTEATE